jgi:murein L,D-transpeptidase YafK
MIRVSDKINPKKVYIRVFKYEKELEVWVSDSIEFHLYKKYPICQLSGTFGPKRKQGDLQVPEGFYYINQFNPNSKYHLSLGLNYPNQSDRLLSRYRDLGGQIYIHGNCVSVGCIAMGDTAIEEIYSLAKSVTDKVEVHIFPINYSYKSSLIYIDNKIKNRKDLLEFEKNIFEGYLFFEENQRLPNTTIDSNGLYLFQ